MATGPPWSVQVIAHQTTAEQPHGEVTFANRRVTQSQPLRGSDPGPLRSVTPRSKTKHKGCNAPRGGGAGPKIYKETHSGEGVRTNI